MRGRGLIIVVLLAAAAAGLASAEGAGQGTVLAAVVPDPGTDGTLRSIIADAVQVQLLRRNAGVTMAATDAAGTLEKSLSIASAKGARYLLVCAYWTRDRRLGLRAALYDADSSTRIGAGEAEGRVDLSLDEIVARALDAALAGITFPAPAPADTSTPGQDAGPVGTPEPLAPPVPVGPASPPPAQRRLFGISVGAAPMIPTGPAAGYTDIGLLATAAFELRFPVRAGTLSAGILSGACLFAASGASSDAFVALVPFGLDAGLRLNSAGIGVALHLGGGPALMATRAPAVSTLLKLVPYALAGMAVEVPFSAAVGLAVQASYAVFFESASLPIMAFAPEVSLYARF